MHKSFESIQRAMRRDRPKTPEPMRGTLPNTDQPRIPNSEYHHSALSDDQTHATVAVALPTDLFLPRRAVGSRSPVLHPPQVSSSLTAVQSDVKMPWSRH